MRVTAVRTHLLEKPLQSPMRISRGGFQVRQHLIVEVVTDEGLTGLGEGVGTARWVGGLLMSGMADLLIGADPTDVDEVRRRLLDTQVYYERKGSAVCAASALEMACWDLKGKALDVPVHELLGGLRHDRLETYASDVYWNDDAGRMAADVERVLDQGFHTVKAHVGRHPPEEEVERISAMRKVLGAERRLMLDVNCGYNESEAEHACHLWAPFDPFWIEEPLPPDEIWGYARLRALSLVPIAAGENEFRVHGFRTLFEKEAIDVAMPDIGRAGGLQESLDICRLAEDFGIGVSPHNFSSGVLLAATIQLLAALPQACLLEMDSSSNAIYRELLVEPLDLRAGCVYVGRQPGLGVALTPDLLRKYRVN